VNQSAKGAKLEKRDCPYFPGGMTVAEAAASRAILAIMVACAYLRSETAVRYVAIDGVAIGES